MKVFNSNNEKLTPDLVDILDNLSDNIPQLNTSIKDYLISSIDDLSELLREQSTSKVTDEVLNSDMVDDYIDNKDNLKGSYFNKIAKEYYSPTKDSLKSITESLDEVLESIDNSYDSKGDKYARLKDDSDDNYPSDHLLNARDAIEDIKQSVIRNEENSTLGYRVITGIGSMLASIPISNFMDDIHDLVDSVNDNYQDLSYNLVLGVEETKELRKNVVDNYNKNLSQYSGWITQNQMLDSYKSVTKELSLANSEASLDVASELAKLRLATNNEGLSSTDIEPIYKIIRSNNLSTDLMSDTFNDILSLSKKYGITYEDLLSSVEGVSDIVALSAKDDKSYRKSMYSALQSSALMKSKGLDINSQVISTLMDDFSSTMNTQQQTKYSLLGLDINRMNQLVRSGNTGQASSEYMQAAGQFYKMNKNNIQYLDYVREQLGLSITDLQSMSQLTQDDFNEMKNSLSDKDTSKNNTDTLDKAVTDHKKSWWEEKSSQFTFTGMYNKLSDISDTLKTKPVLSGIGGILKEGFSMALGHTLFKGVLKMGSGFLGKSAGKATTSAASSAIKAGGLGSVLGKVGGLFKSAGASTTASTATSAGSVLGSIGSKLAPASKVVGKVALPAAIGIEALSSGVDAYQNYKQGNNREAVGSIGKGAGGIGGMLGGAAVGSAILPGVGTVIGGLLGGLGGKGLGGFIGRKGYDVATGTNPNETSQNPTQTLSSSSVVNEMADKFVQFFKYNDQLMEQPLGLFTDLSLKGFIRVIEKGVTLGTNRILKAINEISTSGMDDFGFFDDEGDILGGDIDLSGISGFSDLSKETQDDIKNAMSGLSSSQQEFIKDVLPGAITNYKKYGIYPSVTLGQAVLESGWGNSELSSKYNNLFGIKADSSWSGKTATMGTQEAGANGLYSTISKFRAYGNKSQSVVDHGKFLSENSRYKNAGVFNASSSYDQIKKIANAGYATDPNYTSKVYNTMKSNGFLEIDKALRKESERKKSRSVAPQVNKTPKVSTSSSMGAGLRSSLLENIQKKSSTTVKVDDGSDKVVAALYDIHNKESKKSSTSKSTKKLPVPNKNQAKIYSWMDVGRQLM